MTTDGSGASRAGGEGFHNEDVFRVDEGIGLYLVCDGVSGTPAGEIAARLAAEAVEASIEEAGELLDGGDRQAQRVVRDAMAQAMAAVSTAESRHPELLGLATTVTMLVVHRHRGFIGHRGDSRAYLIRRRRAHQLTIDHELTEEASNGSDALEDCDVFSLALEPRDVIVLCTDGAEEVVQDDEIVRVARELSPPLLASRIVARAHSRQPAQDATAVVIRVRGDEEVGWLQLSNSPTGTSFGHTLSLDNVSREGRAR